jgi:hypothetical protein
MLNDECGMLNDEEEERNHGIPRNLLPRNLPYD